MPYHPTTTRAVYFIGASGLSTHRIALARELGYEVVLTDKDGLQGARRLDGTDVMGHTAYALELQSEGLRVEFVYCPADFGVLSAAAVRAVFELPDLAPTVTKLLRHKGQVLARLADAGIMTPGTVPLSERSGRWVVKPAVGSGGSQGVQVLDAAPADVPRGTIVEPYIEGRHIDVNGFWEAGYFFPAGVLEKTVRASGGSPLPLEGWAPVAGWWWEPYALLKAGCRALGLTEGPCKADMLLTEQGRLVVLEIEPRFHGDVTSCMVLPLLGAAYDPFRAWFTGRAVEWRDPGRVARWRVLPYECRDDAPAAGVSVWRNPKPCVPDPQSTAEIAGYEAWVVPHS